MSSTNLAAKPLHKVHPNYPATIDPFQRPNVNDFQHITLRPDMLQEPFYYGESARVFANSVSDLFHDKVPFAYADMMLQVMEDCPQHQFQMLTKRAERMAEYYACRKAPDNVWVGISVENRKHGIPRIKHLQLVDAKIRWLSIEPLIEDLGDFDLSGIHWVVVGGESGGKQVRPMHIDWVRSIRDQCVGAGIPFFFKQWGSHNEHGIYMHKSKTGRLLDGVEWNEYPDSAFPNEQ